MNYYKFTVDYVISADTPEEAVDKFNDVLEDGFYTDICNAEDWYQEEISEEEASLYVDIDGGLV